MAHRVNTVALVDWHWEGHHPTYFKFFASVLAERGIRVVPLLPAPEEAGLLVATTPAGRSPEALRRIEPAEAFHGGAHLPVRPRSVQRVLTQASMFRRLAARLRSWERRHGTPVDLVFFDTMYDHDFASASRLSALFGWDWAGLYLHARCIHTPGALMADGGRVPDGRSMFRGPRFRGLGVLDEGAIPRLAPILGDRRLVRFPDFTDPTVAAPGDRDAGLASKIESYAAGRPIVALVGHLHRSKGLQAFTRAAQDPRLRDHIFFLGGEANLAGLPAESQRELRTAWESTPNICTHLQRIVEEASLNAIIRAARVLFAAYVDFPHSSNILTKAAVFRRPIIVSDGHLMAERVRRHGLGLTVAEHDVEGIVQAILRLTAPPARAGGPEPGWDEYAALHSYDRLGAAFAELVS